VPFRQLALETHTSGQAAEGLRSISFGRLAAFDIKKWPAGQSPASFFRGEPFPAGRKLAKLLNRVSDGIHFNEHIAADGALVFEHACRMGLEGIVSKRRDLPYRSGRSKCWIKVKNPASPAMLRVLDETW
jgi:hypothetical protein